MPEYNERLIAAKMKQLERFKAARRRSAGDQEKKRLPPGQHIVASFPVLDLGVRPPFDPKTWSLRVSGEVERPRSFSWEEFTKLPKVEQTCDFHCVTSWSQYDLKWGGVRMKSLLDIVEPKESAAFLIQRCGDEYSTNTPLHEAAADDVLLAYELDGKPLPLEHGGPLRMLIPALYAWKSAKFLTGLEFAAQDKPGYWEVRGYHNNGDPWREERYGGRGGG